MLLFALRFEDKHNIQDVKFTVGNYSHNKPAV